MERVQHIIPSSGNGRVVLGRFEHDVEIWDLGTRKQYAAFTTHYDFGGHRVALSDELNLLFAGAYHRYGLSAHDALTGQIRWVRKDLKRIQVLALSADGRRLFCGREGAPCEVVSGVDGATHARLNGTRTVWESAYEAVALIDRFRPVLQGRAGDPRFRLPSPKIGFLDVTFTPGRVYLTESGGVVRCLATETGDELWMYDPGEGTHVLSLSYRPSDGRIVGAREQRVVLGTPKCSTE
jgi:outer membrane protein assembly factor BamB